MRTQSSVSRRVLTCLALVSPLLGCAGTWPQVVSSDALYDLRQGTPRIARMRDLGAPHIGRPGAFSPESDGMHLIGELLLIEGSGFGRQPTVRMAGRPAEVLWRTEGGGLVVRIPTGSAVGAQRVSVENSQGQDEQPLTLSRLVTVLDPRRQTVYALRMAGGPLTPYGQPIAIPGARALAQSFDGSAAYVLQDRQVAVIDLVAAGGPRLVDQRPIKHAAHSLAAAEQAGVLAIVGDAEVTRWEITEGRNPSPWPPAPLPESAQKPWSAALSPSGNHLALALADSNHVVLLDVRPQRTAVVPTEIASVNALPEARLPLLHKLRFSLDGQTLWLSSGDSQGSLSAGHQPLRMTALACGPDAGLSVLKTVELPKAGAPIDFVVSRQRAVVSGSTIRQPAERETLFLTTLSSLPKTAASIDPGLTGSLLRSSLSGQNQALSSEPAMLGGVEFDPVSGVILTAAYHPGSPSIRVAATDVQSGAAQTTQLPAPDAAGKMVAPEGLGIPIAIQP